MATANRIATGMCVAAIASAMLVAVSGQASSDRIAVRIAVAPTPFRGTDGRTHLAYELVVADIRQIGLRIDGIEVVTEPDAKPLIGFAGGELDQRVMHPDADPKARYGRAIPAGSAAIVHVWITLGENQLVPRVLRHALQVSSEGGQPPFATGANVDVHSEPPIVIGSPFRAGTWLAHNGPGQHRSPHWGSALMDGRTARIPQRYAIDFIGVDDEWRAVRGDFRKSSNGDWIGFGRELVAALDGSVHAARDGMADNPPLIELPRPSSPSAADTYGNYVIIKAGDGRFIHYAHLARDSVAVKAGDAVRRGQVIGRLGNSGQTNGAHLHFNVTEAPEPETAQGMPFVFDAVESLGSTTAAIALGAEPPSGQIRLSPMTQHRVLPLDGAVVRIR